MNSKYDGKLTPYLLLLPSILVLLIFLYYPAVQSFILSLYKTAFLGLKKIYVGPENFLELLSSQVYLDSVLVSIIFAMSVLVIGISLSMFIAILLNRDIPGTRFYRLGFIWPYALSPAVAGVIWLFMFNPTAGIVNYITETLWGISPDWVSNSKLALAMVIGVAIWKNLGYNIVFYLASLQNIPEGVMEAAAVDGANSFQRFFYITFSFLKPTTLFLVITNLIYSFFDTFGIIETLTKGGPVNATNIMIYNLYTDGFKNFKSGVAAAQSIILFFLVMIFTIVQFKWSDKKIHYGG